MTHELTKTAEGDLVIPAARLGKLKGMAPKDMRLLSLFDDLLLSAHAQPGQRSQPVLYGDLRLFHVGELIALISSMQKNGTLNLMVPFARKTICFSDGEISFAASTVEDDRLGEVLWRRGHISLEQLYEVHDLVTPAKKLGAILVERGYITPRQLYEGIKEQVLEIVYSTFYFRNGEFVFVEGKPRIKATVRLDISTREIMQEGIRRVDEMTRLEELLPRRESILVRKLASTSLGEREDRLQGLIDGKRTVEQIIKDSHMGEFEALKALAKLRRIGMIDVSDRQAERTDDELPLTEAVDEYIRPLRILHQVLKVESPGAESRLEAYLGSPAPQHRSVFLNVGFDENGRLDRDTFIRNCRREQPQDTRTLALEALLGLFDYAVFQAMDVLDQDTCDELMNKLMSIGVKPKTHREEGS